MLSCCFFGFMGKRKFKKLFKKIWYFIWEDDSIWSWIVNIILAFVLIKFIVYPGLGFILSTSHPVVAVVSESMEHRSSMEMCGKLYDEEKFFDLDEYWVACGEWYESNTDIVKDDFLNFPLKNGFNKGDIMVLVGKKPEQIEIGDIIVFISHREKPRADPIIHRIVNKIEDGPKVILETKGDHNKEQINGCSGDGCTDETNILEEQLIGKAIFKVPLLGYIKIWFVEILKFIGLV